MNEGVFGRAPGVYCHLMACVSAIGRGALDVFMALRTGNQHWFTRGEAMKPFEEMHSAQRDSLHRVAAGASIGHLDEQPAKKVHPVSQAGWLGRSGLPAARNSSAIGSWRP